MHTSIFVAPSGATPSDFFLNPAPDQDHLSPLNMVRGLPFAKFSKSQWFQNVIHNVWRHNLQYE